MLNSLNTDKRLKWTIILAVLGFLAAALYTSDLWLNQRNFPLIPLFKQLPYFVHPLDYIVTLFFFGNGAKNSW